jgi:Arc/MetJ-type ribon-helix-helix transcriptional regulator
VGYTDVGGFAVSSDLSLSSDNQSFIDRQVAIGAFRDRAEAIDAGVELLRKRQELLDLLDERRRQLDNGEYVDFDREGLQLFFEGLKLRARRAAEIQ